MDGGAWARQAAGEVTANLVSRPLVLRGSGLFSGEAGVWLALSVLEHRGLVAEVRPIVSGLAGQVVDLLEDGRTGPSLAAGTTGLLWCLAFLRELGEPSAQVDPSQALSEVARALDEQEWNGHFDLISGLAGFSLLASVGPKKIRRRILKAVCHRLLAATDRSRDGVMSWRSPRSSSRSGINLGVAHGAPAPLVVLASGVAQGVVDGSVAADVIATIRWILERVAGDAPDGARSFIPFRHDPERPWVGSRVAWCYGNPGAGFYLAKAAQLLGDWRLEEKVVSMLAEEALRSPSRSGVRDLGYCHGAIGVLHVFHRLNYEYPGHFTEAISAWSAEAAARWDEALVVESRFYWDRERGNQADSSLLTGASGIALALADIGWGISREADQDWAAPFLLGIGGA